MYKALTGTILVVDDNPTNRYAIAHVLAKAGYRIIEAANGVDGLRQLEHRPELVVVDVRMPEMDGYAFCRRVRADPFTRALPILQISGTFTTLQDIITGLEGGADGYLTHPVDPGVLLATVRALLRAKRAEERVQRLQRSEIVGRLAGGIAHETNNQMAVVLGLAAFVANASNLTPEQHNDVEQIKAAAERVAQLTRQLLALSRRQILQAEVVDLNDVVTESAATLQRLVGPEVAVTVNVNEGALWVRADRTQLVQVLLNLTLNARDAIAAGGRLTVTTGASTPPAAKGRLERTWNPDQRLAMLAVSDTGTGIDPAIRDRIFEPFFSTKPVGQGSGLGLSVVEGIVEQSGGELWLETERGSGTTVTIAIPSLPPPPLFPAEEALEVPAGRGETILVVEDEPMVRATLARGLRQHGYDTLEAVDGEHALELVREHARQIAAVVTDIAMPRMSGLDLVEQARVQLPTVPFVFISGHPLEVYAAALERTGRHAYLQKPFSPDALAAAVGESLAPQGGPPPRSQFEAKLS